MRLILSRKGVDSSVGGFASPIFPDGTLWSVPIPDVRSPIRYRDLQAPANAARVVHNLSRGRIVGASRVHMDPDLDCNSMSRAPGWCGLFGQHGAAQRHLQLQGVEPGDLFLFFGWFRQVHCVAGRWRYVADAPDQHVIFGWMQVGSIEPVEQMRAEWARYHPHFYGQFGTGNSFYIAASNNLQWASGCASCGVFERYQSHRVLTADGCTRSIWQLPGWLNPMGRASALSYHTDLARWTGQPDSVQLRAAARGQEFVLDMADYPEAHEWISDLFRD